MYFVVGTNTIVLYFDLFSEASASFWKYDFRRPKQNVSGLNRNNQRKSQIPGSTLRCDFLSFNIETPSITGQYNGSDRLRKGQLQRRDISGPFNVLHSPLTSLRPVRVAYCRVSIRELKCFLKFDGM